MSWKAIDRYSKDYGETQSAQNIKFYKTPDTVLQRQLEAYDTAAARMVIALVLLYMFPGIGLWLPEVLST